MTNLNKTLLACKWHHKHRKLNWTWFCMFNRTWLVDNVLLICFFELFYLLKVRLQSFSFRHIVLDIFLHFCLLNWEFLKLFLEKISQLLLTSVMLINQPLLYFTEHLIQFSYGLIVTSDQLLFDECKLIWKILKNLSLLVSFRYFSVYHFLCWEKTLVLFDKMMSCMIGYAFDTNVFLISFTKEFEGFVMIGAELIVLSELFFFAGKLESDIIFGEIGGFNLGTMFVPASGTIEHFLFIINNLETLLAYSMTTIKIPGYFLLSVVEIETHRTLHLGKKLFKGFIFFNFIIIP